MFKCTAKERGVQIWNFYVTVRVTVKNDPLFLLGQRMGWLARPTQATGDERCNFKGRRS